MSVGSNTSLQELSTKLDLLLKNVNDGEGPGRIIRMNITDEEIALLESMAKLAGSLARLRRLGLYILIGAGLFISNYERAQAFIDRLFGGG